MTLIEAIYDAREIDLIELPQASQRVCQHRVTLAIQNARMMRAEEESHILEPNVTCFPFESRGLLFDIWIRYYYCERLRQLTFSWPVSLDENITRLGLFLPKSFTDQYDLSAIRTYNAQMREAGGMK